MSGQGHGSRGSRVKKCDPLSSLIRRAAADAAGAVVVDDGVEVLVRC